MAFIHANFKTYEALRSLDITTSSDEGAINYAPGITGKWRLGQMASWSRWDTDSSDLTPITAASQNDLDKLKPLTTGVILFAINLGGTSIDEDMDDWRNFHTQGHRGDSTLKNSFAMADELMPDGIDVPAFYMTDVFKLVPTETAAKLDAKIRDEKTKGVDHVGRCAAILQEELTICLKGAGGQTPVLVAMGKQAFEWLTGAKKDKRIAEAVDKVLGDGAREQVVRMDHYTFGSGSNARRAASLHGVVDTVLNKK